MYRFKNTCWGGGGGERGGEGDSPWGLSLPTDGGARGRISVMFSSRLVVNSASSAARSHARTHYSFCILSLRTAAPPPRPAGSQNVSSGVYLFTAVSSIRLTALSSTKEEEEEQEGDACESVRGYLAAATTLFAPKAGTERLFR